MGGRHYLVGCFDVATAKSAGYFLSQRSNSLKTLKTFKALTEHEIMGRMYESRLDFVKKNMKCIFKCFIQSQGMTLEPTLPYASQSNGSLELLIQSLWIIAKALIVDSRRELSLCGEAILYSKWLRNRLPSTRIRTWNPSASWFSQKQKCSQQLLFVQKGSAFPISIICNWQ